MLYWIVCGSDAQNDNAFDTQILNGTQSMSNHDATLERNFTLQGVMMALLSF